MIDLVQSTKLSSGIAVLTEHMPGLRSVTAGIWVRCGSRHESPELSGICHFIEHAVFKGTKRRTAYDIAVETDRLGGHLDAYTTHELTGFSIKVADTNLPLAFDLIADLLAHPRFDPTDLEREQKVILEEMKMLEDTPDELLVELFNAAYFPEQPLGRPIEGTAETVTSFDHEKTAAFHAAEFSPENLVIAAAGNVEHAQLVDLVEHAFGNGNGRRPSASSVKSRFESSTAAAPILIEQKEELEQAHLVIAAPWPSSLSEERYAAGMLASVLGGGTSSRLWQKIREERGLAYSVGAGGSAFSDVGVFSIFAGTSPGQLDEVLDISLAEMRRVVNETIPARRTKVSQGPGGVVHPAGPGIIKCPRQYPGTPGDHSPPRISPEEIIKRLDEITPEDLQQVAQTYFTSAGMALGALGNLNGFRVDRSRLEI